MQQHRSFTYLKMIEDIMLSLRFYQRLIGLFFFSCMSISLPLHASSIGAWQAIYSDDFFENGLPEQEKINLGKFLFFDKILSGNKNISCATCHHTMLDSGDGLSLPIGEGGQGLGVVRNTGVGDNAVHERVPRNAPPVFNLGLKEMTVFFHDGRLEVDESQPSGFFNPAGDNLPKGLESILAAQAMFPITSGTEMAGQAGENPIADAAAISDLAGEFGVWALVANRLKEIPEYVELFNDVYGITKDEITMVHAANAIAAYELFAFRADNSPFDRFLRGNYKALSREEWRGMYVFYKKANCDQCHSGKTFTDQSFHSIAMPQVGPGKGDGVMGNEDFGRERVTGLEEDRYRFRTPTLRNVALTAPYGHSGAFNTLEGIIRHHLDPVSSLMNYKCEKELILPYREDLAELDCLLMNDEATKIAIAESSDLMAQTLSSRDVKSLIAFLNALTDPDSVDLRDQTPAYVPSGLPLFD